MTSEKDKHKVEVICEPVIVGRGGAGTAKTEESKPKREMMRA